MYVCICSTDGKIFGALDELLSAHVSLQAHVHDQSPQLPHRHCVHNWNRWYILVMYVCMYIYVCMYVCTYVCIMYVCIVLDILVGGIRFLG